MQLIKKKDKYIQQIKQAQKELVVSLLLYGFVILFSILEALGVLDDITITTLHHLLIVFLTILIPVAVALFNENEDIPVLDRGVILYHILHTKRLAIAIIFMIISILIWEHEVNGWAQVIVILLYSIGVLFFCITLKDSYYWIAREKRYDYRFDYLKGEKNLERVKKYWESIWRIDSKELKFEEMDKFINTFLNTIDSWLNKKDYDKRSGAILSIMIQDFTTHVVQKPDKYSNIIWFTTILEKSLEWDFQQWKEREERKKRKGDEMTYLLRCRMFIKSCLRETEKLLLGADPYIFFDSIKEHVEKHKEHEEYIEGLLIGLYDILIQKTEEDPKDNSRFLHQYLFWKIFPEEWKITKENIKNKDNVLWRITFNKLFIVWMYGRIFNTNKKEYDVALDEVSKSIFPEVEPILWGNILVCLVFLFSYERSNEVDFTWVVEHPHRFLGVSPGFATMWSSPEEEHSQFIKQQEESTFELTLLLFGKFFSQEKLPKYIAELKELKSQYQKDLTKKRKVEALIRIFEEMSKIHKAKEVS